MLGLALGLGLGLGLGLVLGLGLGLGLRLGLVGGYEAVLLHPCALARRGHGSSAETVRARGAA